jgi:modulator of FtsH protease
MHLHSPVLSHSNLRVKNKVLSDTMRLLSYTLIFGGLMSWFSVVSNAGFGMGMASSIAALVVIWFVLPKTQNSNKGIVTAFAVAGLLGYSIGPMLNHYLTMPNGASLVMQALIGTGTAFFAISFYAQTSKKDFSFLNGMVFFGVVGILVLSIVNIFFIQSPMFHLVISFGIVLLMGAYLLSQMSALINGGETNYIAATVGLYIGLHNMFTSLLYILGVTSDD